MSIRKRTGKEIHYEVTLNYKDQHGVTTKHRKGGFLNLNDAKEYERAKLAEIEEYGFLFEVNNITLNELFDEYMERYGKKKYRPSTVRGYYHSYDAQIRKPLVFRKIASFSYRDMQDYINSLATQSVAFHTKKTLNVLFNYAVKSMYILENPMSYVTLSAFENNDIKEEHILSEEELIKIIECVVQRRKSQDKNNTSFISYAAAITILLSYYQGLRISEAMGVLREDIDFESNLLYVSHRLEYAENGKENLRIVNQLKTKDSKATLPLSNKLKPYLQDWLEYNPYEYVVCDIEGNLINPEHVHRRLNQACDQLDIPRIRFHYLRHMFSSNLVSSNVQPKTVQKLTRHSNISTTLNIYVHAKDDDMRNAIDETFNIPLIPIKDWNFKKEE